MWFIYWLEDVFYGARERHPTALLIAFIVMILAAFAYAGSMDYEVAKLGVQASNETAIEEVD